MRILLVDDDEDDHDIFREAVLMVKPDCQLTVARDGEQGLLHLNGEVLPDYIFLDINMPKMDGKEFLKTIKANPALQEIPVVIYSTSKHRSALGEYIAMGASNYLTKPSEFNLLVSYLKSILH
jgi:CheY-like chemotaxis protein